MKVRLARCGLGSSPWRYALTRVNGILDSMKAAGLITGWRNDGESVGEGAVGIYWSFFVPATGPGHVPVNDHAYAVFMLHELLPPLAVVMEVLES